VCTYLSELSPLTPAKLANLLALRSEGRRVELLFYADGEVPGLRELVEPCGGAVDVQRSSRPRGRSYGLNSLALRTRADVLVFADAGVLLDGQVLSRLEAHFADREVGCVGAAVAGAARGSAAERSAASVFRRFDAKLRTLESDTGSTIGADGALFAVRAALHHPAPAHVLHDMYVSMMVLCGGHRVVYAADIAAVTGPAPVAPSEFERRRDLAFQAIAVHRLLWPMLLRLDALSLYKYVSHKWMRWFAFDLLALSCAVFVLADALAGSLESVLVIGSAAGVLWLLGRRLGLTPFAQVFDALCALTGTAVGAARSLLRAR
jgi:hypothetical protein